MKSLLVVTKISRVQNRMASASSNVSVVLVHGGQPRTEFYAKDFLRGAAVDFYNLHPKFSNIPLSFPLLNKTVRDCIKIYGERPSLEDEVANLASEVSRAASKLLPEYVNIRCIPYFAYNSAESLWSTSLEGLLKAGCQHVILLPLHPHFSCGRTGLLLNSILKDVHSRSIPAQPNEESMRIVPNTDISFKISAIDRWGSHPALAEMWSSALEDVRSKFDTIVFAVPDMRGFDRRWYSRSVYSTCERIAERIGRPAPWRIGFYNSWMNWKLPLRESLNSQIRRSIGRVPNQRRVMVVPVTDVLPSFDSFGVLPGIVARHPGAFLLPHPEQNTIIVQGMAELLKNHLLGRTDAQIQNYCTPCFRKDCDYSRLLL